MSSAVQAEVRDATRVMATAARDTAANVKTIQKDIARLASVHEKSFSKCKCNAPGAANI